jgi:tetratricopeptide (TPR) repeat protein
MELKDFNKAIEYFSKVKALGQTRFLRPAQWYMALSYIALGNSEMALENLREIAVKDDRYGTDAEKILERLK